MEKKIIAVLFCIIILGGAISLFLEFNNEYTIDNLISYVKENPKFSEKINIYLENTYDKLQLALNKKEIGNFTYYRDLENNSLMIINNALDIENVPINSKKINKLNTLFIEKDIPYIFINIPDEIRNIEKFRNIDYGNVASDILFENMDKQVHFIDLRKYKQISDLSENFYKTDHHMNIETVFETYKIIVNEINSKYELQIPSKYIELENYEKKIFPNTFFGSKGVNVGENYIQKEDFILYLPEYDTDFEYKQINTDGKEIVYKKGEFSEALINKKILENSKYINKYVAFLYSNIGKAENIIINHNAENNKKVLIISNSYARSLVPYFSQCFYETRQIDPQLGRFEGDVLEYIENYNPDIVIMMYDAISDMSYIEIE